MTLPTNIVAWDPGHAALHNAVNAAVNTEVVKQAPRVPLVPTAALSIESPYDGSGQAVHPDVVYVADGWGSDSDDKAWKYWMVYTPYWRAAAEWENPTIVVSDDGLYWVQPPGITNPIDAKPGGTGLNSDPDLLIVGDTMYCYYREHDTSSGIEYLRLRTSADGITWGTQQAVLDTSGEGLLNRQNMISPAVVHNGSGWVMFYSKQAALKKRTSADGITWGSETSVTLPSPVPSVSHVDAIYSDGRYHLILQDAGSVATSEAGEGARKLWLLKSEDGTTFTASTTPLMVSEHMAQRMIYRTCGLHEVKNGKDYYRLWASCVSYSIATNATEVGLEADSASGVETYYIGYAEGYDPDDTSVTDQRSVYEIDALDAKAVRGAEGGFSRLFARFLTAARGTFDRLRVVELRSQALLLEGPSKPLGDVPPGRSEWVADFGYVAGPPPLVVASPKDHSASWANNVIAFHRRSSGDTPTATEGWHVGQDFSGNLKVWQRDAAGALTLRGYFSRTDGSLNLSSPLVVSATAASSFAGLAIFSGDRIRIGTAKTPTGTADSFGGTGDICRDDSYIYVKTSTGWKRAALSTW